MKLLSPGETRQALIDKELNEIQMAARIRDVFENTPEIMAPIRLACKRGLEQLVELWNAIGDSVGVICASEKFLKVWQSTIGTALQINDLEKVKFPRWSIPNENINARPQRITQDDNPIKTDRTNTLASIKTRLGDLATGADNLTVTDCGDVIRLFGTVVEILAAVGAGKITGDRLMPYVHVVANETPVTYVTKVQNAKLTKLVAGDDVPTKERPPQNQQQQQQHTGFGVELWEQLRDSYRTPWNGTPFDAEHRTRRKEVWRIQEAILSALDRSIQGGVKAGFHGNTMNTLNIGSTVRAIDMLLGLPQGADISGTTGDNIFTLETLLNLCAPKTRRAVCILLPLASMIPEYHHTTIEVALTLTMNGYITYAVGFYSTLYPSETQTLELSTKARGLFDRSSERSDFNAAKREIKQALTSAESDARNRHMLVFAARDGQERALVMETIEEIAKYRKFVTMTQARYDYFCLPKKVTVPYRDLIRYPADAIQQIVDDVQSDAEPWQVELEALEQL